MKHVDVVIPVFNNNESLDILVDEISKFNTQDVKIRIILVDDGSTDESWKTISKLAHKPKYNIHGIKLTKNFGQLSALKAGYSEVNADAVVTISADLQDPPNLVNQMIEEWKNGARLVICSRTERVDSLLVRITSFIAYKILGTEVNGIPKGGFDTFLMDKKIFVPLIRLKGRFNFLQADVLSFGVTPKIIEYSRLERPYGKSEYTFAKRYRNFVDGLVDSSYLFIRWSIRIGSGITFVGFFFAALLFVAKLQNKSPFNGFTLIACSILIIGGVQIMMIGILGSYIWRIYDAARERPAFLIDEIKSTR
jgi:glycosyltransferase involved in cell wall biosynthesis